MVSKCRFDVGLICALRAYIGGFYIGSVERGVYRIKIFKLQTIPLPPLFFYDEQNCDVCEYSCLKSMHGFYTFSVFTLLQMRVVLANFRVPKIVIALCGNNKKAH